MRWLQATLTLALPLALVGCAKTMDSQQVRERFGEADREIAIAVSGLVTPASELEHYLALSELVGAKTGREVRLIHKSDCAQVSEMLRDGRVDVAFVCSGPYAAGHDEFGLQLVAAPVVDGTATYSAYIIVPASSEATSLASLRGSRFAFTDPLSNAGRTIPTFMMLEEGIEPDTFFKETVYTYGHDRSIRGVANGEVDAAGISGPVWEYLRATGAKETAQTRVLVKSEPCGIPPVVARPGLDPLVLEAVTDAFESIHEDPEGRAILHELRIERFVQVEDSAYDSIRLMLDRVDAWER